MAEILLHACCAPCATASIQRLQEDGRDVVLYFANSNIDTPDEFARRLDNVVKLAENLNLPLHVDEYDHAAWLEQIRGLEDEPEKGLRCEKCFAFNLGRSAQKAKELGIKNFTTTLTISPHKPARKIFEIGAGFEGYVEYDFKKKDGFKRSIELSREHELYRQNYCGCEFSRR